MSEQPPAEPLTERLRTAMNFLAQRWRTEPGCEDGEPDDVLLVYWARGRIDRQAEQLAELQAWQTKVRTDLFRLSGQDVNGTGHELDATTIIGAKLRKKDEQLAELRAYRADIENSTRAAMDERCDASEDHCTCVSLLRARIAALELRDERQHQSLLDPMADQALAVEDEREACAVIAAGYISDTGWLSEGDGRALRIARAIRARGEEPKPEDEG